MEFPDIGKVVVKFDDAKTGPQKIIAALKRAQLTVEKPPQFVNQTVRK
ncbi:MAG: hypothetical protein K9K75_00470 [Deltaproteobacteria bacterium]|nr:hypothetical protein [Deltaproteobacteria bacterium]